MGFKFRDHHCYSFAMIAIIRFMTVLLFSTLLLARVVLVDVVVVAVVVAVVVVVLVVATAGFRDYGFGPQFGDSEASEAWSFANLEHGLERP